MNRYLSIKVPLILAIAIVLSLGVIFWGISHRNESPSSPIEQKTSPYPVKIEGLSHSTYNKDRLIAKIEADEFKVNQRKFFIFNIKPFNEATLTNVRLKIYLYEDTASEIDMFPFGKSLLSLNEEGKSDLKGMGLITRGVIKGLTLEVYKADKLSLVVKAREVYIDFKRKKTRLVMASIEDISSDKLIKGRTVIWNNREKTFDIPGEYIVTTSKGMTRGKGIKVHVLEERV